MPNARTLTVLACLLTLVLALPAAAREGDDENAIRLMESMSVTPDGATIVFSWRGDLWSVPAVGGPARRLTFHPGNDIRPHVSPDGHSIGFVSDRTGVEQVHIMPLGGGRPKQVTTHSEGARLYDWFPDSKSVLIRTQRDDHWRDANRLYRKALDRDAKPEMLFDAAAGWASVSRDGNWIAFTRERSAWYRKGYRGPSASQIWLYGIQDKTYTRLSEGEHGELWPMWGVGKTLYFVSEEDGTWNLWRRNVATGEKTMLTRWKGDGVSYPAVCENGKSIVFRRLFDTYRFTPGSKPTKVVAFDTGDPSVDLTERRSVSRASAASFTSDAREIAFIGNGDLWVMDTELKEPKRITSTAAEEKEPFFSKDFSTLYFISEAGGASDIWRARRADDTKYWWQNSEFLVEQVTKDADVESDVRLTPDGKRIAYLRGTNLWTMDLEGKGPEAARHVIHRHGLHLRARRPLDRLQQAGQRLQLGRVDRRRRRFARAVQRVASPRQ